LTRASHFSHHLPKAMVLLRPAVLLFSILASSLAGFAQTGKMPATVTFTFDFPGSIPERYSLQITESGDARYESGGMMDPRSEADEPFAFEFKMSPANRARVFELAAKAGYFEGNLNYTKGRMANTGAKTLSYRDGARNHSATYNYSTNVAVQQLTQLCQNISATLEFERRLEYLYRYQKLALDEELKRMEQMSKENSLAELQAIAPMLRRIAADQSVINVVRLRAQRLVGRAENEAGS
jgi:hypothetical protein